MEGRTDAADGVDDDTKEEEGIVSDADSSSGRDNSARTETEVDTKVESKLEPDPTDSVEDTKDETQQDNVAAESSELKDDSEGAPDPETDGGAEEDEATKAAAKAEAEAKAARDEEAQVAAAEAAAAAAEAAAEAERKKKEDAIEAARLEAEKQRLAMEAVLQRREMEAKEMLRKREAEEEEARLAAEAAAEAAAAAETVDADTMPAEETSPDEWEEVADPETGHTYWYNHITGESQWEPPVMDDAAADTEGESDAYTSHASHEGEEESYSEHDGATTDAGYTESEAYATDHTTDHTTDDTTGYADDSVESYEYYDEAHGNDGGGGHDEMDHQIVPATTAGGDWEAVEDPDSGGVYYYNATTGESAWEIPKS